MSFFPPLTSKGLKVLKDLSAASTPTFKIAELRIRNSESKALRADTTEGIVVDEVVTNNIPELSYSGTDATYFENISGHELLLYVDATLDVDNVANASLYELLINTIDGSGARTIYETSPAGAGSTIISINSVVRLDAGGSFYVSVRSSQANTLYLDRAHVRALTLSPGYYS